MIKFSGYYLVNKKKIFINQEFKEKGIYGFVSNNGSGKSSFFNSIFKLEKNNIFYGSITIDGYNNINNLEILELAKKKIFYIMQFIPIIENITYLDIYTNMYKNFSVNNIDNKSIEDIILFQMEKFNINKQLLYKEIGLISGGEKKLMEILIFTIIDIKILFIDEIDTGTDINNLKIISSIIKYIYNKNDLKIFIISHNKEFLNNIRYKSLITISNNKIVSKKV